MILVYFLCVPHDVRNGGPVIELIQSGRNGSADPMNAAGADPGFQPSPIDRFGNCRCDLSSFQPCQNVLPFNPIVGLYLTQSHQNLHQFFSDRNTAIPMILGISDLIGIRVSMEYITFDGESPMSRLRAENGRREPWKMKFFGLGNESWGCGGNMFPEDYAARYRLYQSFLHDSQKVSAEKIAVGPAGDDYDWTEKLLEKCYRRNQPQRHGFMDGLSVHYYMYLHGWEDKGSALSFTDEEWVLTMQRAYFLKEILEKHAEILDRYDPEKKIGLVVDEWGNWFWTEEGTNPGFLYQQNSMRDAVSAGLNLNVFNKMSDRITMTNIAQMINVLQSMLLTQGAELVKTPTYFVYRMFLRMTGQPLPCLFFRNPFP